MDLPLLLRVIQCLRFVAITLTSDTNPHFFLCNPRTDPSQEQPRDFEAVLDVSDAASTRSLWVLPARRLIAPGSRRLLVHVNLVPVHVLQRHAGAVGLNLGLAVELDAGSLHPAILLHAVVGEDPEERL